MKMDSDLREGLKSLGTLGTLGFTLVICTFAGLGIGLLLDKLTGLKPVFTIIFLLFGIVSGFVNIFVKTGRFKDDAKR
ncbi:MAG: hypothetical protein CVV21_12565 [Candidatus Goldiibacteriota bacterium HGW-Goldbacteria-1]|jgi:ATP synthase protein I|nr:MAG: hypothetical protein CVV21_12565 [Candidatus Goldiibacteriota bacterium HGW-Goldbacteria-1]